MRIIKEYKVNGLNKYVIIKSERIREFSVEKLIDLSNNYVSVFCGTEQECKEYIENNFKKVSEKG